MAEFSALIYVPYFLQSLLAIAAPMVDRNLWNDLHSYMACYSENTVQHKMIEAAKESLFVHFWYLTEELLVFGLFNNELSNDERRDMAKTLFNIQTRYF